MQTWIFQIKRQDGYKTAEWTTQELETLEFEEVITSFTIADPTHNRLFASAADDKEKSGDEESGE